MGQRDSAMHEDTRAEQHATGRNPISLAHGSQASSPFVRPSPSHASVEDDVDSEPIETQMRVDKGKAKMSEEEYAETIQARDEAQPHKATVEDELEEMLLQSLSPVELAYNRIIFAQAQSAASSK